MKDSPFVALQPVNRVILAAGHGGKDTGACFGEYTEREEAIEIVNRVAALLVKQLPSDAVVIAPHKLDTHETIPWLVEHGYTWGNAWALELHRDSASGLAEDIASLRCGVYHGPSKASAAIGQCMAGVMRSMGAHSSTWARPDTESRFTRLGWIRQPSALSHLLELGFMEGRHDSPHLDHLARIAAAAILAAFDGRVLH